VFQFYSAPRLFRITGKDGAEQFFKMHITEDEATGKKKAYISRNGEVQTKEYLISGEFDVRVVTGSTLPFARAEKEQRLLNLFDRGVIDDEEVLKGIEYPNWEAVKARVEEKKAMAAQAQAQPQPAG
jgi:hypothetical protein